VDTKTVLRVAVVAEWVFGIVVIILSVVLEAFLPEPLQDYVAWTVEQDISLGEILVFLITVPLLLVYLVSSVGLFLLKNWARWLYLWTTVVFCFLYPFFGPTVEHGIADAVDEVTVILSGVIIGIAFFGGVIQVPNNKGAQIEER